ncbi:hypothetical protein [Parageobacillus thermoglucosidasius]|uniref:hypothetical protein n=1 Tax=Parageobacillus thermoglucosidasius TaxID=1426 RepID=UPI000E19AFAB|nr:hypothetical protein [Parageobacillus thermoglucosidasius]MED4903370.1 hypothetical protein [Parageobacillus thermoglucosidasius]MED4912921.1 hypothetical protein [Parageobacillus thermoglucosidasius]MED4945311.1 hypothetical protein [Parageobacillus thermoglucosidasius]MED4984485.1 hypothetical protein [Parageobacillus thermoglucosidasius]RDE23620.1 hypothetical protein DV714_14845 [Parageobacillus thermoglucosidasius]
MFKSWKKWMKQTANTLIDRLLREKHSFSDIARLIREHPDTSVSEKTWLGLTYRFYSLHLDKVALTMETKKTKGNDEHILFIAVSSSNSAPIVYRSYDENSDLHKLVTTPPLTKETAPISQ